ncbi:sugar phosphate isomerase/epimerase family protein [Methanobrevibacter curvatus]|uniref:Endonuclease 4 n=1 Tax=Methanobrevibacter curvatus TaxID=49547 RepID=A0A166B566_9EURY|nr:sugar phosphate isomerase/epimerase family protein [Methanobrevibacter curvatus]KZX12878.1 endonuclease 4 [Methanobrevibacter curvatus]
MKLGFSTLSLFMNKIQDILEIAYRDNFNIIEILCEGPYMPRLMLKNKEEINFPKIRQIASDYDIEIFLHGPTVDINPASMNQGIREESRKQIMEALEIADLLNGKAVTTHPGVVHRREKRIRDLATNFCIETFIPCQEFAEDLGIALSIENMPKRFSYLGNCPSELNKIANAVGCGITIDWGHANTYENPEEYLKLPNINYFHLNDNNGIKDQHLNVGDGTADFSKDFLKKVDYGIIELNNYENVLLSRDFINKKLIDGY